MILLYTINTKVGMAILLVVRLVLISYITVVKLLQRVIIAELSTKVDMASCNPALPLVESTTNGITVGDNV